MLPKLLVVVFFVAILASLGSALFSLVRKKEGESSERMARALTLRVGLSVALFVLLFVLFGLGIIQPHGLSG